MTWVNRLKLLVGLVAVLAAVAASTLIFNQRQLRVDSTSATIAAAEVNAGSDYGGYVSETLVRPGDAVKAGEVLLVLESQDLANDIKRGTLKADGETILKDGTYKVTAPVSGVVASMETTAGSYTTPGSVLATVYEADTMYIEAEYLMSPDAFGRLEDDALVEWTLPDRQTWTGTIESLEVSTTDGDAEVVARVTSDALEWGADSGLMIAGTPLSTTLSLRDDGPLDGVTDSLADFAHRIGL
ncbi:HlyD family secretion protein [Demequina sp. NBRC 110054]|uniref:HlyD family efflux transporter periplasmic adaptor subunit n=1 Tax=Demequina sp. NBRC 110054 TaxID=1570343 RepID=UPI0009FF1E16|nr:HlyD family secretion protein [Demequina sp. NBRC 110054]